MRSEVGVVLLSGSNATFHPFQESFKFPGNETATENDIFLSHFLLFAFN